MGHHIREATPTDSDAIGLVTVSATFSAFLGAIPEELLDWSWTPGASAAGWRETLETGVGPGEFFLVAEDMAVDADTRVVGFVWACMGADTAGYNSTIRGLYVLPTSQRCGVGTLLISAAVDRLRRLGATAVEIGCVEENPSCDFYRHLGGVEIGRRPLQVDAFETVEILFGWTDLDLLGM